MPKRKGIDPPSTAVVKIRIPIKVKNECLKLQETGYWSTKAESSFLGYLLEIGLNKYKKSVLPGETSADEPILTSEKKTEYGVIPKEIKEKAKAKRA